jgi:hypothetical protein
VGEGISLGVNYNRKGGAFEKEQPKRLARRASIAGDCESKNTESTEEIQTYRAGIRYAKEAGYRNKTLASELAEVLFLARQFQCTGILSDKVWIAKCGSPFVASCLCERTFSPLFLFC